MIPRPPATVTGPRDTPLINPMKGRRTPDVGPTVVMTATLGDLGQMCRLLGFQPEGGGRSFFNSRLFVENGRYEGISIAGPFMGAPHAVILLENLIAWGARRVIFLGWCGSMAEEISIGDIVVPGGAIADDGTSRHYRRDDNDLAHPSTWIQDHLRRVLASRKTAYHEGLIWSMDAIYRETPAKIAFMQERRAVAVEMELAAVFNVARFRHIDVGALLVVSDELASMTWKPGFTSEHFKQQRKTACEVISALCRILSPPISSIPSKN